MGLLTFALNVTLDGCCDHREGIADDALLRYYTRLVDETKTKGRISSCPTRTPTR
jgi:hypothetical protein